MITYEQALENILKSTRTLPVEKVLTAESLGRILAEDIISGLEMPAFDRSAMDGYALNHLDAKKIPVKLKSIGLIQAGEVFNKKLKRGECVKIMTGARVPENADCVVMVEYSRISAGGVEILKFAQKGENIFFQGEDFKKGQIVLEQGTKIFPSHIGILAAVGRKFLKVFAKPKVAVLNTGGEIVSLGNKLSRNKIYNSNGPMLQALLESDGILPVRLGIAKDNSQELKEKIKKGFAADILLISGGVSMGDYDLVPAILEEMGVKKIFHKVNIKPGKPVFFGTRNNTVIFGVPGNPVSNFVAYHIFIRAVIQKMMGAQEPGPGFSEGITATEFPKRSGRRYFALAKISIKDCRVYLSYISGHSSADTLSLARADSLVMLDDASGDVKNKEKVKFITWRKI